MHCGNDFGAEARPYRSTPFEALRYSLLHLEAGMRRREFITLLGGLAVLCPLPVRAQQTKIPVIGFLGTTTRTAWSKPVAAFERRLNELGWFPGRTITIDYQWTEGHNERALEIAKAFVERNIDIMVVGGNVVAAAKQATASIPIVFPVAVDPVGSGFVDNLGSPGGNVTGLSLQGPDAAGKRLDLLRTVLPKLQRVAIMANVGYPAAKKELAEALAAARALGLEPVELEIKEPEDIGPALDSLHGGADALYVVSEALSNTNHARIASFALAARLPTLFGNSAQMERGGLLAYGARLPDLFRRAADYVDKILRGTKPSDIPIEQPTEFALVINLKTAKALGLTIPDKILALADEVIE